MQKTSINVWVNETCSKQINITPTTVTQDIISLLADLLHIPLRARVHLELHFIHNSKDHSIVPKDENITNNIQTLANAGYKMDESNHKNKYALVVNHDAIKKAQKHTGQSKSSWSPLSYFKKRTGVHQRSISLPVTADEGSPTIARHTKARGSNSSEALLKTRPQHSQSEESISPKGRLPPVLEGEKGHMSTTAEVDAEKMPAALPHNAPMLAPRLSISPPRAGMRVRSKTLTPSLSQSDLRNQEALNQMITQRIKNRASLGYERPPLTDPQLHEDKDENSPKGSPRAGAIPTISGSPRSASPPPPQRLFEPPPTIVHLSPSTSSSSISIASASLPATAPRQRALTTSGALSTSRLTPPRSQHEMMQGGAGWKYDSSERMGASWKYESGDQQFSTSTTSSSVSSSTSSSPSTSIPISPVDNVYIELLGVVELLKKAT